MCIIEIKTVQTQISQAETSLSPSVVYHNHRCGKSVYRLYKDRVAVRCSEHTPDNSENSEMAKEKWDMLGNHIQTVRVGEGRCQLQLPLKPEQTRVWLSERIQWFYHIKKNMEGRWQLNTNVIQQFWITHHHSVPASFALCKHRHIIGVSFKVPWISLTRCDRKLVTSSCSLLCLYLGYIVHSSPVSNSFPSQLPCVTPEALFLILAPAKILFTFLVTKAPCA